GRMGWRPSACSLDLVNTSGASSYLRRPLPGQRRWHPELYYRPSGPPGVIMAVWLTHSVTSLQQTCLVESSVHSPQVLSLSRPLGSAVAWLLPQRHTSCSLIC